VKAFVNAVSKSDPNKLVCGSYDVVTLICIAVVVLFVNVFSHASRVFHRETFIVFVFIVCQFCTFLLIF